MASAKSVEEVAVEVRAVLGRLRLPVSALASLKEGDCVEIERVTDAPVKVTFVVNDKPFAHATLERRESEHVAVVTATAHPLEKVAVFSKWRLNKERHHES